MSIFEQDDYVKLILSLIEQSENQGRGLRRRLAEAIGCQVSHITAVLHGNAHFSLEQADAAGRFFGLKEEELEFLLLLVQFNRSGTQSLKNLFFRQLQEKKAKYFELKDRLKISKRENNFDLATYYSSWQYGAVHMLATIPEYNTASAMARKLKVKLERINEITNFLVDSGILRKNNGYFEATNKAMHLERQSPLISKHHINWRLKTLSMMDCLNEKDLHYTSAVTLSKKDFEVVKEILVNALAISIDNVKKSKEEEVAILCLSWQFM